MIKVLVWKFKKRLKKQRLNCGAKSDGSAPEERLKSAEEEPEEVRMNAGKVPEKRRREKLIFGCRNVRTCQKGWDTMNYENPHERHLWFSFLWLSVQLSDCLSTCFVSPCIGMWPCEVFANWKWNSFLKFSVTSSYYTVSISQSFCLLSASLCI